MPNTTNNNWPTPADTDLVKNGADAIRDLGNAIDTTLGVYSPSTPGLVKINTTSFSGVASQSINDVFSATYDNYLIIIHSITGNGTITTDLRMRASGTDNTSSYSWGIALTDQLASSIPQAGSNVSGYRLLNASADRSGFINLNVNDPFIAQRTLFNGSLVGSFSGQTAGGASGGVHAVATSFTGFTIVCSSLMTGKVSVYGYSK